MRAEDAARAGEADVRRALPNERDALRLLLTEAFFFDPIWLTLLPDEAERRRFLPLFMDHRLSWGFLYGEWYAIGEPPEGTALWLPPGKTLIGFGKDVRAGGLRLLTRVPWGRLLKAMALQDEISRRHRRLMRGPHFTLALLAVASARQGRGLASALLTQVLERAAGLGLPAYLETQNERNVGLYEHFGFRTIDRLPLRGSGRFSTIFMRYDAAEGERPPGQSGSIN